MCAHVTNMSVFSPSQVQILKSFSACWPTLKAEGWMISECLFFHCQGYKMGEAHQHRVLQRGMQATCVTWSPNFRLASYFMWCKKNNAKNVIILVNLVSQCVVHLQNMFKNKPNHFDPSLQQWLVFYTHRGQGWMNSDALHLRSATIPGPNLLSTKIVPTQTHLIRLCRGLTH